MRDFKTWVWPTTKQFCDFFIAEKKNTKALPGGRSDLNIVETTRLLIVLFSNQIIRKENIKIHY